MSDWVLILAISVSLLIGYGLADWQSCGPLRRWVQVHLHRQRRAYRSRARGLDYYNVLTGLLNETPDEALDSYVGAMTVNDKTLEVHLALGAMLRRRGEFDRALRVHQHLLAHPNLPFEKRLEMQLEMARDYWRSGILDRAEALLEQLVQTPGIENRLRRAATENLVSISQELGNWLQAIEYADQLTEKKFARQTDQWRLLQAQFCCELASRALISGHYDEAVSRLNRAQSYDPHCGRAQLLRARLALALGESQVARQSLLGLAESQPGLVVEVLPLLEQCHCLPDEKDRFINALRTISANDTSIISSLMLVQWLHDDNEIDSARAHLLSTFVKFERHYREMPLLQPLFDKRFESDFTKHLQLIKNYFYDLLRYACGRCGFVSMTMLWRCPSCGNWDCLRPGVAHEFCQESRSAASN